MALWKGSGPAFRNPCILEGVIPAEVFKLKFVIPTLTSGLYIYVFEGDLLFKQQPT